MGIYSMDDFIVKPSEWPWGSSEVFSLPGPEGWSGNFITVGSDKDYPNLSDAYAAAVSGDIILLYGTTENIPHLTGKPIFIRGINSPTINNVTGSSTLFNANILFENINVIETRNDTANNRACVHVGAYGNGVGNITVNKCQLTTSISNDFPISGGGSSDFLLTVKNSSLTTHSHHLSGNPTWWGGAFRINQVSLEKVLLNKVLSMSGTTGNLAVNDSVPTATEGYGHEYGDFLITDDFLQAYGY